MDNEYPSTHTSPWLLLPEEVGLEPVPPPEVPLLLEELRALVGAGGPSLVEPDEPELPAELELFPDGAVPLPPAPDPLPPPVDWDDEEFDEDVDFEFPCPLELA